MDENTTKQPENLLFPELFPLAPVGGKQVEVSFTAPDLSSEGGLLLSGEFERYNGMLVQRIFQIACGYDDADDCDLLRDDFLLKLCAGKLPDSAPLSSQPTMSRLENKGTIRENDPAIAAYRPP